MAKARTPAIESAPDKVVEVPKIYRNVLDHPVEVLIGDAGVFLPSTEFIDLMKEDVKNLHNKALINDGSLKEVT